MGSFVPIDDTYLIRLINDAKRRIVYVAPGATKSVAEAIKVCLQSKKKLDITIVMDPDEDVCRIGYGDLDGLTLLHEHAKQGELVLRKQPGLRVGVLIVDDDVLVWSPVPRSVEIQPSKPTNPNGILLGAHPATDLVEAIAPEGSNTLPADAEIGREGISPEDIKQTSDAIKANPVVPVDLAAVTRVFSTKLQFVELEIRNAHLSKAKLSISRDLLNADVKGELRHLLESHVAAFGDLRDHEVEVPAFTPEGKKACDEKGARLTEKVTEASLQRERQGIERRFLYRVGDDGLLIQREKQREFESAVKALEQKMSAHFNGVKQALTDEGQKIVDQAMAVIKQRSTAGGAKINEGALVKIRQDLTKSLATRAKAGPQVKHRYKDVTYAQTKDQTFRERVDAALPPHVKKQLGPWAEHFSALKVPEQSGNSGT